MDIDKTVQFMRDNVDPNFNFIDNSKIEVPFTELNKKIKDSKLVLISSGGFHLRKDKPFDTEDPFGDPSYRVIPKDTDLNTLDIAHAHYDHKYVNKDLNSAFPLELLKELERKGEIGTLANEHYSFMGYCLKTEKLKENARKLSDILKNNDVEMALIAPTWPICNQSVGLIARELESNGISTVTLNLYLEIAKLVVPPRTVSVNFPFGAPFGDPNNKKLQLKVIRESLKMLEETKEKGRIKKLSYDWREQLK